MTADASSDDATRYVYALLVEIARTDGYAQRFVRSAALPQLAAAPHLPVPAFDAFRRRLKLLVGLDPEVAPTPLKAEANIGIEGPHATARYEVHVLFDDAAPDPSIILSLVFEHSDPGGVADYQ